MLRASALAAVLLVVVSPAWAHDLRPDQLARVGFDQRLGAPVPLDLAFRDDRGQPVTLGSYFGQRPVLLTLNYLHCQNLCPVEIQGLIDTLNAVPFMLGDQFSLVTVSIDPRETPEDAAAAKVRGLRGSVRPSAAADGWHILTGSQEAIDQLTQAVGFNAVYDDQEDDYAHPAGVVVLTLDGQVSRYLYGIDFSANDVRLALVEAASDRIGSLVDRALLVCYHYDLLTGRYTPLVMDLLKAGGATSVLGLAGLLLWLSRRG